MEPFLKQLASLYAKKSKEEILDTCFVFPNKRSIAFFNNYLKELLPQASLLPETTDIDSLVMSITKSVVMPRIEQLFLLYNCYQKLRKEVFPDADEVALGFDSFMTWGEMVLNDFNDVDRYLVDKEKLFRNIEHFKEIAANFLTEEQIEIINRYFKDQITFDPDAPMWRHISHDSKGDDTILKFFNLWVILDKLYTEFGNQLAKVSKTYSGAAYRQASEILSNNDPTKILPFKKYIFVGFNILSTSEKKIFTALQKAGIADFYWDVASPLFSDKYLKNLSSNPAVKYLKENVAEFPTTGTPLPDEHIENFPNIKIIGVPSTIGQVKKASSIVDSLLPDDPEKFSAIEARKTAVVLPDETLCIPLVNSLSPKVQKLNITMGYSVKNSPISSLMTNIIKLQSRSRRINTDVAFYFEDLIALLSHPILKSAYPKQCDEVISKINTESIFNFRRDELLKIFPEISPFLISPESNLFALKPIRRMLEALKKLAKDDNLSRAFVVSYLRSLDLLAKHVDNYNIFLSNDTIYHLLQRLAGGEAVHFSGEPLEGIQIMGLLETRALDFENLIILSMNEDIFPRSIVQRSFIPAELRNEYKMSTIDHQESIFAYYFYRLITRCENVFLIYDTRGGNSSAEMSRYLYQLMYAFPDLKPVLEECSYPMSSSTQREIVVEKTPDIMAKLNLFRTPDSNRWLSASSINTYINCPLEFYLKYVGGYTEDDDLVNYIDDSLFGTIIHSVFENIYKEESRKSGNRFDAKRLNQIITQREDEIEHYIVCAFKQYYFKQDHKKFATGGYRISSLPGETALLANIIKKYIKRILNKEATWADIESFNYLYGEHLIKEFIKFTDKVAFNIKGYIDRVDTINAPEISPSPVLRFIDYKTGDEPTDIKDIDELFITPPGQFAKRAKGLFQLMIYCNAYNKRENSDQQIVPIIFNLNKIMKEGATLMNFDKKPLKDYHKINDEFLARFEEIMTEMFDSDTPFVQAENKDKACHFCDFKGICDIQAKKSF